jgi:phage terminase Nu1 subunit (DNA packaging protein)
VTGPSSDGVPVREYVTREELAELMRVSVPTIDRMRREGMPTVTWGRRLVRFNVREAVAWAQARENGDIR